MSIEKTAKLIEIKNQTIKYEAELERLFSAFSKKQRIDFERPNDYGKRHFVMNVYFDEFNIEAFKDTEKIKEVWTKWMLLRKEQRKLEIHVDSENAIENGIRDNVKKSTQMLRTNL